MPLFKLKNLTKKTPLYIKLKKKIPQKKFPQNYVFLYEWNANLNLNKILDFFCKFNNFYDI